MSSRFFPFVLVAVGLSLSLVGCSDDAGSEPESDGSAASEPDAGAGDAAEAKVESLGLTQPTDGFQVRNIGAEVQAGEDVEYCEVVRLPGEPSETYYARSFELGNASNSHHLIINAATPGGEAEKKLEALGVGNRVECVSAETRFGDAGFEYVAGSQQPYHEVVLPEGVGQIYHGGQLVVFDYHYFNIHDEPVSARSAINFHLTSKDSLVHLARDFGFRNWTIATPPGEQASFTGECHFNEDLRLSGIRRHTHHWGTDFTVWYAGGSRDGEQIWTTSDWQHATDYKFDEPVLLRAGEGLRFRCDYYNDSDHLLRYGTRATDEMCILFGTTFGTEGGPDVGPQDCSVVWNDADGIGHTADEAGGFPVPSESEAALCLTSSADDACSQCRCEACAAPTIQCAVDSDCSGILSCYNACPSGANCNAQCQTAIDDNSSGLGPFVQMASCYSSKCAAECSQ